MEEGHKSRRFFSSPSGREFRLFFGSINQFISRKVSVLFSILETKLELLTILEREEGDPLSHSSSPTWESPSHFKMSISYPNSLSRRKKAVRRFILKRRQEEARKEK
jgi:hypothetical protein